MTDRIREIIDGCPALLKVEKGEETLWLNKGKKPFSLAEMDLTVKKEQIE